MNFRWDAPPLLFLQHPWYLKSSWFESLWDDHCQVAHSPPSQFEFSSSLSGVLIHSTFAWVLKDAERTVHSVRKRVHRLNLGQIPCLEKYTCKDTRARKLYLKVGFLLKMARAPWSPNQYLSSSPRVPCLWRSLSSSCQRREQTRPSQSRRSW